MEDTTVPQFIADEIRPDFVPAVDYISPKFAELEQERLWPRVWQIVCRHEEIPKTGDFVTYDILDDSITVVRTADGSIKAFHNSCPHRGLNLTTGCGNMKQFVCSFHAWRFDLNGNNTYVQDREDWGDCLKSEDISLLPVRAESWGGWVWINMDPDAEPLLDFLAPIVERCKKLRLEDMRFRWYKTVKIDCNWKVVLEAFNEGYHIAGTHPSVLAYLEDYTNSESYGRHSAMWHVLKKAAPGSVSPLQRSHKLGGVIPDEDYRKFVLEHVADFNDVLKAMVTERTYHATQGLRTELPASASQAEVMETWGTLKQRAAEAEGIDWPDLTAEDFGLLHQDWHVFPNTIFLPANVDGVLWYRARPDGGDPNKCIFDIWSLQHYAAGEEPKLVREYYADWREGGVGRILTEDFGNVPLVQRGMRSRGYRGARPNPVQEKAISNFHRALREFIS